MRARLPASSPPLSAFVLILGVSACGEDRALLDVPRLGTTWVLVASAGGGRPLEPEDVAVRKATEVDTLEIPGTGNVTVDMLYAGLREEDLPAGLTPDTLVFTTVNTRNSRALPPLVQAHVLAAPSPPGTAGALVPVAEVGLSTEEAEYRRERLDKLLERLRIADPCRAGDAVFETPRIPATGVSQIRVSPAGDVYLAFAATSTTIIGRFRDRPGAMTLVGVDMGEQPIEAGEASSVTDLGDRWVDGPDGVPRPAHLTITRGGALGHLASTTAGARRYTDDTPRALDPAIGRTQFSQEVDVGAGPELCVGGQASGSGAIGSGARVGGLWCRTSTGGPWRVAAAIPGASRISAVLTPRGLPPLMVDYSGTVYTGAPEGSWTSRVTPAVNQGCGAVACNRLDLVAALPDSPGGVHAVVAGDDGEAWTLAGSGERSLASESLTAVARALFGDEKKGGASPIAFTAIHTTPDGAVWLGSQAHFLVRVSPDLQRAERVCRDGATVEHPVTAIGSADDGRLIFSTTPPIVSVGTWR